VRVCVREMVARKVEDAGAHEGRSSDAERKRQLAFCKMLDSGFGSIELVGEAIFDEPKRRQASGKKRKSDRKVVECMKGKGFACKHPPDRFGKREGMVRREEEEAEPRSGKARSSRCACLSGGSPVSVSVGAPSSRSPVSGRDSSAEAGCRKPGKQRKLFTGEQECGPQHEVKPGASTKLQSESRSAHITGKATVCAQVPKRACTFGGVGGAARNQGHVRNTRDPSHSPLSRQGGSYKQSAKASAGERKSERIVVALIPAQNNAGVAKGPCGEYVQDASTCEGMPGKTGANHPHGRKPVDKVRQLQRALWSCAKRSWEAFSRAV
jgi:hypothetical protein